MDRHVFVGLAVELGQGDKVADMKSRPGMNFRRRWHDNVRSWHTRLHARHAFVRFANVFVLAVFALGAIT